MDSSAIMVANHMSLNRQNQEKVANNIANSNTRGFQADKPMIVEDERNKNFADSLSFAKDVPNQRDVSQGEIVNTSSKMDVALLTPDTYFSVQDNTGQTLYTRNGQLSLNAQRQLIQIASQFPISDTNQGPISIPEGTSRIDITSDGTVSADGHMVARIGAFKFEDSQKLTKNGNTLMKATPGLIPALDETAVIQQESVESSNVNPIIALTQMIELQRQDSQDAYLLKTYKEQTGQQLDDLLQPLKI